MNRKDRRAQKAEQRQHLKTLNLPDELMLVPQEEFARLKALDQGREPLVLAFWSRKYIVSVYAAPSVLHPNMLRLSINRVNVTSSGQWKDGLTWDEIQAIKTELGYGEWFGVECYPPTDRVINVANIRHIWVSELPFGMEW